MAKINKNNRAAPDPLVSIILTTYNEPLTLVAESIQSILQQTYTNWQLILVNDNPGDQKLHNFISKFIKQHKRIVYLQNQKNLGLTKSLNKALGVATGKYIARQDADDSSKPARLRSQVDFMERNPQCMLCGAKAEFIDDEEIPIDPDQNNFLTQYDEILSKIFNFNPFIHSTLLFRRALVLTGVRYNEHYRYAQDYEMLLRIVPRYEVRILPEKLIVYRLRREAVGRKHSRHSRFLALRARYENYFKHPVYWPKFGILLYLTVLWFLPDVAVRKIAQKKTKRKLHENI